MTSHDVWQSPLSYRYGSDQMRSIWSEIEKRKTWRRVWLALARSQSYFGLVSDEEVNDIATHINDIDVLAAEELEREIKHDLVAELRVFASQCPIGGRVLHLGATSMDIEDNADALRTKHSLKIINFSLHKLLSTLAGHVDKYADHITMGFTHLQPAEPISLGYRFASWSQDLLDDAKCLNDIELRIKGKGIKGATGTSASYIELLESEEKAETLERLVLQELGIDAFRITTQTCPRKQELTLVNALASLGQSLYKLAYDIRLLQSPVIGELSEPFGKAQVGSSAMPFKKNPVAAENIDSLARQLAALPRIAWDNAAHSHLERTLDDSANRRSLLPEAFLLTDALLSRTQQIIENIVVNKQASRKLLETYGVFAATEKLLMEAVKCGADRLEFHEVLRQHCLDSWHEINSYGDNRLILRLGSDERITKYIPKNKLSSLMDVNTHTGNSVIKAKEFAAHISHVLAMLEAR